MKRRTTKSVACFMVMAMLVPVGLTYHEWQQRRRDVGLIMAVKTYDLPHVLYWLRQGADPNARDDIRTEGTFWQILQEKLRLRPQSKSEEPSKLALYLAVANGDEQIADTLLTRSMQPLDVTDKQIGAATHMAVRSKMCAIAQKMLERGAAASKTEHEQLLCMASEAGSIDLVKYLLNKGIEVNAREGDTSAVVWAAANDHAAVAELLLQHGAAQSDQDRTDLLRAALQESESTIYRRVLSGEIRTWQGGEWLCLAARYGSMEVVGTLLRKGVDVNARDDYQCVAILKAAQKQQWSVVRLLLAYGADVNVIPPYDEKMYPVLTSCCEGPDDLFAQVLAKTRNVNATMYRDQTALMLATEAGSINKVRMLLQHGAKVNAKDCFGTTALVGAENNFPMIAALLKKYGAKR